MSPGLLLTLQQTHFGLLTYPGTGPESRQSLGILLNRSLLSGFVSSTLPLLSVHLSSRLANSHPFRSSWTLIGICPFLGESILGTHLPCCLLLHQTPRAALSRPLQLRISTLSLPSGNFTPIYHLPGSHNPIFPFRNRLRMLTHHPELMLVLQDRQIYIPVIQCPLRAACIHEVKGLTQNPRARPNNLDPPRRNGGGKP